MKKWDIIKGNAKILRKEEYMSYLKLENVCKEYNSGTISVPAVKNISFEADNGELVVILGSSGAGKTTLLNLLGGMDSATDGKIVLDGVDITHLNKKGLTTYRRQDVGFIFQFYNLMPNLTAKENVEIAVEICKDAKDPVTVLEEVGLSNRMDNFPSQLSGGEQQRVSIARAVAKNPKILLCDEPTGALDYNTGKKILKLLEEVSKKQNKLVIIVTHNQALKDMADKVLYIKNGQIEKMVKNDNPKAIEEIEW